MTYLRRLVRLLQPMLPRPRSGIHVLAYHLVGAGTGSPVDLPFERFRAQMEELAESGTATSLDRALRRLEDGDLDGVRTVVTFDDAYENFAERAWPLLEELRIPVTLYVPTGFVDGEMEGPLAGAESLPPIPWKTLSEQLETSLLTVGSHTHRHVELPKVSKESLHDELIHSKKRLQDELGRPVEHFCYPRARSSRRAEAWVRGIYRSAVLAGGRINRPTTFHPYRLQRTPVRRDAPVGLSTLWSSPVWLEEWLAARVRILRSWLS